MRNWLEYVREKLELPGVRRPREAKIIEDVARQLEDFCREGLARGMSDAEADAFALAQIKDWESLTSDLLREERPNRESTITRWRETPTQKMTGGMKMLSELRQDLAYGVRMLRRSPGFTAAAVLTLALGIGANATIYSWLDTMLLNPYPGVNSDNLFVFARRHSRGVSTSVSYPDFEDFRRRSKSLAGLLVYENLAVNFDADNQPERVLSEMVSENYFDVLDVRPALGRGFLPEEGKVPGEAAVAVISYSYWQRRFGGDESALGKAVELNKAPFTIVGIAPEGFQGTQTAVDVSVWVPVMMQPQLSGGSRLDRRGNHWINSLARLKPGVTLEQAAAELTAISNQLTEEFSDNRLEDEILLFPPWASPSGVPSILRTVLFLLAGVTGFLLLIACANVANLLLARALGRQKEMAVRLSLGAGRGRLVRQLLAESLLLALLAGMFAVVMTHWTSWTLMLFVPPVDVPLAPPLGVSMPVLVVSFALSVLTVLLFGLLPAFQATRFSLNAVLTAESGRASGGRAKQRLRNSLVVAQVALSMVLLVTAGLFLRSLQRVREFSPGFNPENVLLESIDLRLGAYEAERGKRFALDAQEAASALPGVEAAAFSNRIPLSMGGSSDTSVTVEGYEPGEKERVYAYYYQVSHGYLRAMQIPLLEGREFSRQDTADSPLAIVISKDMAERYWKDGNALGGRVRIGGDWATVIGIAGNIKLWSLDDPPFPLMYLHLQRFYRANLILHTRTKGDPADMALAVREVFRGLDPALPVYGIHTLKQANTGATLQQRLAGNLLGVFGLLALGMSAIGLYGVLAYVVGQRRHEIGIRMALGAERGAILGLVLKQGAWLAGFGLVLGTAGAFALTRFAEQLLFGVSATDPLTFGAVGALLLLVSMAACYVPARRATQVDPIVALRYE